MLSVIILEKYDNIKLNIMFFVFGPLSQLFNFIQCITTTRPILTQWLFSTAA